LTALEPVRGRCTNLVLIPGALRIALVQRSRLGNLLISPRFAGGAAGATNPGGRPMTDHAALSDFFDRLGSDDAFRAQLEQDPAQALSALGVQVPAGFHSGSITLPSKEEVQANKATWLAHAEAAPKAMMMFFYLK
jgi:putative modified peptide